MGKTMLLKSLYSLFAVVICLIVVLVLATCGDDNPDTIADPGDPIDPGDTTTTPIDGMIASHLAAAAFDDIPAEWIDSARTRFNIYYGHTSHGSQIVTGMSLLRDSSSVFAYNAGEGTLALEEYGDDLGGAGDTSWVTEIRVRLNGSGSEFNLVMWSWCGGVSENTAEGINAYLDCFAGLEADYPNVIFVYMTGHLDGTGADGNLYQRNNQIRDWCAANDKVLFDFADIESYDPDGAYFPDASDACEWCSDWCASHNCYICDCSHSHCFNCYLKGRAFWWLMARAAGWDGN